MGSFQEFADSLKGKKFYAHVGNAFQELPVIVGSVTDDNIFTPILSCAIKGEGILYNWEFLFTQIDQRTRPHRVSRLVASPEITSRGFDYVWRP